jgi:microcystin-dependent protein
MTKSLIKLSLVTVLFICSISQSNAGPDPFVGEVQWVPYNFAPRGWALCDGQLLPIAQNTALFSLLGTTYGGDGRSTFALPNMQSRHPMHPGSGPGLTPRRHGDRGGEEQQVLVANNLPAHKHFVQVSTDSGSENNATDNVYAHVRRGYSAGQADTTMSSDAIGNSGSSQALNTPPPYLTLNCIIALQGIYPSR